MTLLQWLTVIPGVIALLAAAAGYGALRQRLINVETESKSLQTDVKALQSLAVTVGRIDERTRSTEDHVGRIDTKIDSFFSALLGEQRDQRNRDAGQRSRTP